VDAYTQQNYQTIYAVFMTSESHAGNESYATRETLQHVVTVLYIEEPPEEDHIEIDQVFGLSTPLGKGQDDAAQGDDAIQGDEVEDQLLNEMGHQEPDSDTIHVQTSVEHSQPRGLLTPDQTPETGASLSNAITGRPEDKSRTMHLDQRSAAVWTTATSLQGT
jgi:hypothetical protein